MHRKKLARIIAFILVLVLILTFILSAVGYVALAAPSDDEINKLIAENEELAQKIIEVESQINSFEFDTLGIFEKKTMLDRLVILTETEITNLNKCIDYYDTLAYELQDDLLQARNNEQHYLKSVTSRLRAYEENGFLAYIGLVFEANDFAEFLGRVDLMKYILEYDEYVYDSYLRSKEKTEKIIVRIDGLENEKAEISSEVSEKEKSRDKRVAAAESFMAETESSVSGYEMIFSEVDAGIADFEDDIANKKAEQIRLSPQIQPGTGAFIWPVTSSSTVSLSFGTKLDPTYNVYRVHNGVDISADYGSDVVASDGGMVTATGYNCIYGSYVVINHGNGFETVYAQLGAILVEEGQQLTQGAVIARVGSTGYATKAHLHFEIRKEEVCKNPLSYFIGYSVE